MPPRRPNVNFHLVPGMSWRAFPISDASFLSRENAPTNDSNWSMRLGVYDRLFTHHTFNSIRRNCRLDIRDMIPNDSLDFALSSIYLHNEDYNVPKSYIPMQPETLNIPTWNVDSNGCHHILFEPSRTNKSERNRGKFIGLGDKKVDGPRMPIATSLPLRKTKMKNFENSCLVVTKEYKKVSDETSSGRITPRQRHDKSSVRHKYAKSSSSIGSPLPSGTKYSEHCPKTKEASTIGHGQLSSGREYVTILRNVKSESGTSKTRHGRIHSGEKFAISAGNMKSTVMIMATDKTQRRETYAAQLRAIERIHPSSLKLAVNGPHSDQTNPGYSRKIDGTFYGV